MCTALTRTTFLQYHINAFLFFGGVPERVVPDNLKQAIVKASFTEPMPNMGCSAVTCDR